MDFSKIIAVTGKPGLFKVISQTKTGVIVESLDNQKRFPITSTHNISMLENIAIFSYEEDIPLLEVFKAMYEKSEGKEVLSHKESGQQLQSYFLEVVPNYDEERVYVSNIKKVVQWFNILVACGLNFSEVASQTEKED